VACLLWLTPIAASTSRDVLLRIQRELFVGKRGFMSVARESATDLPCDTNTSTWRSFGRSLPACDASSAFWSSCLPKDIPQGGPIHWGWISSLVRKHAPVGELLQANDRRASAQAPSETACCLAS